MPSALRCVAVVLFIASTALTTNAQTDDGSLTAKEVEQVRDTSYNPADRVNVFIRILDDRTRAVQELLAKTRHAGREDHLHDLFAQMNAIADELDDNLDDYTARHRDVRKALPKLIAATERWTATLQAAPPDERYDIVRRLALAAVRDAHDSATALGPDQTTYFTHHPDAAKAEKRREDHDPHDVPDNAPAVPSSPH